MTRAIAAIAYLSFASSFSYMVLFCAGLWVPRTVDSGPGVAAWLAAIVDLALIASFGVTHSLLARPRAKQALRRWIPESAQRSVYVLIASAQIGTICALWLPLGPTLWSIAGPAAWILGALQAAGWLGAVASTFHIDHLELFGLRQAFGLPAGPSGLRTPGLYRVVRHPLYLGILIGMWSAPVMTAGHLLFAAAMTAYIVVGARFEERDLVRHFGDAYREYRARVPMLIPWIVLLLACVWPAPGLADAEKDEALADMNGARAEAGEPGPLGGDSFVDEPLADRVVVAVGEPCAEDIGDVAVLHDDGTLLNPRNPFSLDLEGGPVTLRYVPAVAGGYTVSTLAGAWVAGGVDLGLGDDTSRVVDMPGTFAFFGAPYGKVTISSNGHIVPGSAPASARVDEFRSFGPNQFVDGQPKIAGLFADLDASHAAVKVRSLSDRLIVSWIDVPIYDTTAQNTFQITLYTADAGPLASSVDVTFTKVQAFDGRAFAGITGITSGRHEATIYKVRHAALGAPLTLAGARTIMEVFTTADVTTNVLDMTGSVRAFYGAPGRPDRYNGLVIFTEDAFANPGTTVQTEFGNRSVQVKNVVLGIQRNIFDITYLFSPRYGDPAVPGPAKLQNYDILQQLALFPRSARNLVDSPLRALGDAGPTIRPAAWQVETTRVMGTYGSNGERDYEPGLGKPRFFAIMTPTALVQRILHEVVHSNLAYPRMRDCGGAASMCPDRSDLLGRDDDHWSFFLHAQTNAPTARADGSLLAPAASFAGSPRSSVMEGSVIRELGPDASRCPAGTSLFASDPDVLVDGLSALDLYLMGLRRHHGAFTTGLPAIDEVGGFWFVGKPSYTFEDSARIAGTALDLDHPFSTPIGNVAIDFADRHYSSPDAFMSARALPPFRGGVVEYCGVRDNRTALNIQYASVNRIAGNLNFDPSGVRGRPTTRTGFCAGDRIPRGSEFLCTSGREVDVDHGPGPRHGQPQADVTTLAFVIIARGDTDDARPLARHLDTIRQTFDDYASGPAVGYLRADGSSNLESPPVFDTRLDTPYY